MIESYLRGIRAIIITKKDLSKMENKENIYIDKSLGIIAYGYSFSQHQQCFNDFGETYGYEYTDEHSLVKDGNICFEIAGPHDGKYVVANYLPNKMDDIMIAAYLEVINKMKDSELSIFAAETLEENNKVRRFQFTEDFNENIYCDIVSTCLEKTR